MNGDSQQGARVTRRTVLHFTGFEPLDAEAHRRRYERAAKQSAGVWQFDVSVGPLKDDGHSFDVTAQAAGWRCDSTVHVFDHGSMIEAYRRRPLIVRLASGFAAAARVIGEGAVWRYFRHAWRFSLFFVYPFAIMIAGLLLAALVASAPYIAGLPPLHLIWSVPIALAGFRWGFIPFSERYHVLHLFSDWQMALALARLDDPRLETLLRRIEEKARGALDEPADEILVTSHSIGSNIAVHVLSRIFEDRPQLFRQRRFAFVTLGGAILQCALMRNAGLLRERVGTLARAPGLFWLDIQCLTDVVNFYRSRTFALCGHGDTDPAQIRLVRFKKMLDAAHYKRIKHDFLRVHRQYVLGPERRSDYDFTLLTAGPLPAAAYAATPSGSPLTPGAEEVSAKRSESDRAAAGQTA